MASYGLFASGCLSHSPSPGQSIAVRGWRKWPAEGDSKGFEGQHSSPSAEMFIEDPVFPQHACVLLIFKEGSTVF